MALQGALAGQLPGEKVAHGTFTPVATSTDIVTGLESIRAVMLSFAGAPTVTHLWNSWTASGGVLTVVTYGPTDGAGADSNIAPTAGATAWGDVCWVAIGQGAR
jgi:hypothetical protein